jgi:radical SAM superfamily enzyme YgiQ (UPF0313 family)
MVPLHLATIAALTPDDIEVDLWDEPVHGGIDEATDFNKDYDLVGITGYSSHLNQVKKIAQVFRRRGTTVAIGGVGASTTPERLRAAADVLFIGEAELTWPRFIEDWKSGNHCNKYRQVIKPDLATSPVPRWDSITNQMHRYLLGAVQTMRGCPFDCEFCDVVHLFGRRPRHKPVDRVLEEVAALKRLGMEYIFFCDDNFIGDPHYTKELLRELIPLNNSLETPVTFSTQLTVGVAKDEELLRLLADSNFGTLFIGIETPKKESLREANKFLNLRTNLVDDCKKIQSYGMVIKAGMIVGFDHDDRNIFNEQFEFAQESCVPLPTTFVLKAPPGTRLWTRLQKEGRLLKAEKEGFFAETVVSTNIVPKGMTRAELFSGYLGLIEKLSDWRNFEVRIKGMLSDVKRQPNVPRKKRRLKRLFQLIRFLASLDGKTRRSILNIIRHTRKHKPFMIEKVFGLIIQHYGYARVVQLLREDIHKQMELEKSGEFKLEARQPDTLIPASLRQAYQEIFPEIHSRVYMGLQDKTRTDKVVIDVFADFLTHWGTTLDQFSDHHRVFLNELTDRTITKENRVTKEVSSVFVQHAGALPYIEKTHLAEEVLKAVEQELRIGRDI